MNHGVDLFGNAANSRALRASQTRQREAQVSVTRISCRQRRYSEPGARIHCTELAPQGGASITTHGIHATAGVGNWESILMGWIMALEKRVFDTEIVLVQVRQRTHRNTTLPRHIRPYSSRHKPKGLFHPCMLAGI